MGTILAKSLDSTPAAARRLRLRRIDVSLLLLHARHLPEGELALVRGVYERGLTVTQLAKAAGLPVRPLRTRLNRALDRLADPLFRFVLQHHERWSPARRAIARAVFLRGRTWREAAAETGHSLHRVRREVDRIRVLASAGVEGTSDG